MGAMCSEMGKICCEKGSNFENSFDIPRNYNKLVGNGTERYICFDAKLLGIMQTRKSSLSSEDACYEKLHGWPNLAAK